MNERSGMWQRAPLTAVVIAWIVLVAWRPFVLGFYHDDWWSLALPPSVTPVDVLIGKDPARATMIVLAWAFRSLFGANAAAWQALGAAVHLLCAVLIFACLVALHPDRRSTAVRWAAAAGAVFWLSAPWSLPYSGWPIMSLPLLSVACLAASGWMLLCAGSGLRKGLTAGALFIFGALIYEAVWGAFVPVAAMAALARWKPAASLRPVYGYAAVAGLGQVLLFAANRLLSAPGTGKAIAAAPFDIVRVTFRLAMTHLQALPGSLPGILVLSSLAVVAALFMAVQMRERSVRALLLLGLCAVGILGSVLLHALAGYAVQWDDLMGRTAMVPSFWLALAFGIALASIFGRGGAAAYAAAIAGAAVLSCFAGWLLGEAGRWAVGWREQQRVIASFPLQRLGSVPEGAIIAADIPRSRESRGNFDAYWDISGALASSYPGAAHVFVRDGRGHVMTARPDFWTLWDGTKVSQGWCHSPEKPLWSFAAPAAFVWRQSTAEIAPLEAGKRLGCGG